MIKVVEIGGRIAPQIFCDHCGKVIDDYEEGNAEWESGDRKWVLNGIPYFTHKRCCLAFEESHGGRSKWSTAELGDWLIYLISNTKADTKAAREHARLMEQF